jgi:hypothetical protein
MRAASAIGHPNRGVRAERCLPGGLFVLPSACIKAMRLELSLAHTSLPTLPQTAMHPRPWTFDSGSPNQNAPFHSLGNPSPLFRLRTKSNAGFRSEADLDRVFADHPGSETLQTPFGQIRGLTTCL